MQPGAHAYPSRGISIVVPFPAGFALDFIARLIAPEIEKRLGQPITIENRPGDLGNYGNEYVAQSPADGYILVMSTQNMGVFPHVYRHLTYDPLTAFAAIGETSETPGVCTVAGTNRFRTFADLMSVARKHPGSITYGTASPGAPSHLIVELLAQTNNVRFRHHPFTHASLSSGAIVEGDVDFTCNGIVGSLPLIKQGKLRALAVSSARRSQALPDVPTMNELGFGPIDETSRHLVMAPAKTPRPILDLLAATLGEVLHEPGVQRALYDRGFDLSEVDYTPAEADALIQSQYAQWGPFLKTLDAIN